MWPNALETFAVLFKSTVTNTVKLILLETFLHVSFDLIYELCANLSIWCEFFDRFLAGFGVEALKNG